ncbi:MAG: M28 family metallopeptidase [Planctomycetota bacterium]
MSARATFAAILVVGATLAAQGAGAPPTGGSGGTTAAPALPDLGPPAAPPDGAPPHVARIDRDGLRAHAYWLADDARAGRYTTSAGQQATAKYVADHWKKLGLKPLGDKGWLQSYPLRRTVLDAATAVAYGASKHDRDLAVLAVGETKVALAGRFVFCGNGSAASVPPGLAGRIPVVALGAGGGSGVGNDLQAVQRFVDVAEQLHKQGAVAGVVCLLGDKTSLGNTLNYRALLPDHPQLRYGGGGGDRGLRVKVPLLVLSAAQGRSLLAHCGVAVGDDGALDAGKPNDKAAGKLSIVVKEDDKGVGSNVVGVLEGTTKKAEAIVFSAHHDHVGRRLDGDAFNGADDNASGTAGLLELAEAFALGGPRPARSIVFLSVSGEELGLWGSDWFAAHPTWPLDKIVANVNIDMIGRAGRDGDGPITMQVTPSHQHEKYSSIVRDAVALAKGFGIAFTSGDTYYERSDHYNFAKVGVPVVFFCDGEHPDYHQVTDTPDRLHYDRMEAVARLAFWTGWNVANDKGKPTTLGKQPGW